MPQITQKLRQKLLLWKISNTGTEQLKQWDKTDLYQYPTIPNPSKSLQANINLTTKNWCALNRARCRVGQSKQNLNMWKIIQDPTCDSGQEEQTMDHILFRCPFGPHCKDFDLKNATKEALAWLSHWCDKIRKN